MLPPLLRVLIVLLLVFSGTARAQTKAANQASSAPPDSQSGLTHRLATRIAAWHDSAPASGEALKVVYFHPNDAPPQTGYRERLTRMLIDIGDFLGKEMQERHGFAGALPLEIDADGQVFLHLVEGQDAGSGYTYQNGEKVRREVKAALGEAIDFDKDFVLVICGLCQKRDDGSYFFHSPYYGDTRSDHRRGLCYAADCEMLDTLHLTRKATGEEFAYEEHLGKFTKNLAAFNSLYIGGLAHELGHGLSLPHNGQTASQRQQLGSALMGSGNHTYHRDRFTDRKGSFLTAASALRLATHPLFTGSDKGRDETFDPAKTTKLAALQFEADDQALVVKGRIESSADLPAIAVIAYLDPEGGGGYDALTEVAEIDADKGTFEIRGGGHRAGAYELRLTVVHPNGATITPLRLPYGCSGKGVPDATVLSSAWYFDPIESLWLEGKRDAARQLAKTTMAELGSSPFTAELSHLLASAKAPRENESFIDATTTEIDHLGLSEARWRKAEVGWGLPRRDYYYHGPPLFRDAVLLRPGGDFHVRGLYAHTPARYEFELGGKWKSFSAVAGMQRGVGNAGQAQFVVVGDGKELFRSKVLKGTEIAEIQIDVSGVKVLELVTESGKQGNGGCWSVWGTPLLSR